ncbi:MAG: MFS transporter [Planctomycetota bacterium]
MSESRGQSVLAAINPEATPDEIAAMADDIAQAAQDEASATGNAFFSRRLFTPIMLVVMVAVFNQLSGINAILYFAPRILGMAGLEDARTGQVLIGVVNLVFTIGGLWLIDRVGRRTLLLIGSVGYIASLAVVSATFYQNDAALRVAGDAVELKTAAAALSGAEASGTSGKALESIAAKAADARAALVQSTSAEAYVGPAAEIAGDATNEDLIAAADAAAQATAATRGSSGPIVLLGILAFIAAHAIGQGAVIWVLISEVFPNEHRAAGNSLGSGTHWVFAALVTRFIPQAVEALGAGTVFAFFGAVMVLQLLWVLTAVPETKGVPLEELQRRLGVT